MEGEAIFSEGVFIDDRDEDRLKVQLYRLGNFYVEVFYSQRDNAITHYRPFTSPGQLAPYVRLT